MRLKVKFSPITQKRIGKFKKIRRANWSLKIVIILFVISLFAEFIANNKPLLAVYQGEIFFPVFKVYEATEFGEEKIFEPDYKAYEKSREDVFLLFPPIKWGYNESNKDVENYPSKMTLQNPLGTDNRGRDVLTRILYGIRVSFLFALMNYFVTIVLANIVGGSQGFIGGKYDLYGQRVVEIWSAMPYLLVLILLRSLIEGGFLSLVLISAIFSWIFLSYYVRGEIFKVRKLDYVQAATAIGSSKLRNYLVHVVPNSLTPLITFSPFIITNAILTLSFLDFLGFGVQAPTASIGELLDQGRDNFTTAWWLAVYPFLTLVFIILLLNFIGEGVRTAFDPRKSE